jgi:hypothetical protein
MRSRIDLVSKAKEILSQPNKFFGEKFSVRIAIDFLTITFREGGSQSKGVNQ